MALSQPIAAAGLVIGVTAIAGGLVLRLWYERRHREKGLSEADSRHFARQDLRRSVVAAVMVLLAACIGLGSAVPHRVGRQPNPQFLAVWLAVIALIFVLIWLAILDWIATWLYGRRHRRAIDRARIEYLRSQRRRRRSVGGNGEPDPGEPRNGASAPGT
jgi:hypothetical protein